jgi:hypothetical protein
VKRPSLLVLLLLTGCKVGGPSVADTYRIEARDLRKELEQSRAENAELKTKLAQLAAERSTPMSPEAVAALPALAKLAIGDYSGLTREIAPDNRPIVRIYVQPTDARGRVIQITGTLEASVAATPDGPPLGSARLGPAQLRDAYRAGFMGVYYTIDVPVPTDAVRGDAALHASVRFVDGLSGAAFAAAAPVSSVVPAKP